MMFKPSPRIQFLLIAVSLAAFLTINGFGQQVYGSIYGTVTDASGAAVPGAKVVITDQNKGAKYEAVSNESGNYSKAQLAPGLYTIEVSNTGFQKAVSKDVTVNVDQAARVDIALTVGDVATSVEVTAAAPLLQSDRSEVATTFTSNQLENLPSFDRNFQAYELLTPGTQRLGWNHASSEDPQGSIQIQINGQNFAGTGFQLDGTDNQDPILGIIVINPALDSITETHITTQNYDAEFGVATAGLVVVSTKSGSNEFHGSAFEYLRNNSPGFQDYARNPFNGAENNSVPAVKWNQFGGSVGGPLIKNKLFWFGDAQLTRRRTGSSVKTSVPSVAARGGNLSEFLANPSDQIYDPKTGDPNTGVGRMPFVNNLIPGNRISTQAQNILKLIPGPNAPGDNGKPFSNNYVGTGSEAFDSNQWDTRWDYYLTDKTSIFGRYSYAKFSKFAPGAFGLLAGGQALDNIAFAGTSDVLNQSLAAGVNHTFGPSLVTEFRFGFVRYRVNVLPNGLGTSPANDAGIPGLNKDTFFTSGLPFFDLQGDGEEKFGYSLGANQCNCPLAERETQYQFVSNSTKVFGNHSIKFGADLRFAQNLRVPSDSHRAGELYFSPGFTSSIASAGAGTTGGLGLATFLLGQVTSFNRYVSSSTDAQERQKRMFWYAQDTWRITPKLTLNYGLRWDMIFPETVNHSGNGGQLDLRTGLINVFGVGQVSDHGIQDMNWRNLAPRLGVTYQLTPKTVVRAGYGWSYSLGTFGTIFGHNVTQNLPVLANQSVSAPNNFSGVFTLAQGPPTLAAVTPDANGRFPLPDGVNGKARPLDVRLPRVDAYNLTVQHQLGNSLSISAGYVGNVGRHVFAGDGPNFNINQPAFIPGLSNQNLAKPFFAKYGWTQGIDFYCDCAQDSYNSLQIQVTNRFKAGFTLQASYAYQVGKFHNGDSYSFLYDRKLSYGNRDWMSHNTFTAAENFEVPFGHGKKYGGSSSRAMDFVLGGWNINGVTTWYSGLPFTPRANYPGGYIRPYTGPGDRLDRANSDPYSGAQGNRNQWFVGDQVVNGALVGPFPAAANNIFGNMPINSYFGPQFINQDLSLGKNFRVTERAKFGLRAEAFNVFNHTALGLPNNTVTDSNAGQINGLPNGFLMRRLQFSARLDF
jgi:hypothetical protein